MAIIFLCDVGGIKPKDSVNAPSIHKRPIVIYIIRRLVFLFVMLVQKALSVWDRRNRALQTEVANEAIVLGFSKTRRDGEEEEEDERRRDESRERKVAIYSARNERARSGFLRRRRRKGEGSDK